MRPKSPFVAALFAIGLSALATPALAGTTEQGGRRYHAWTVETGGDPVYCINHERVDSRIPQRICMTKSGWIETGARVIDASDLAYAANDRHPEKSR